MLEMEKVIDLPPFRSNLPVIDDVYNNNAVGVLGVNTY